MSDLQHQVKEFEASLSRLNPRTAERIARAVACVRYVMETQAQETIAAKDAELAIAHTDINLMCAERDNAQRRGDVLEAELALMREALTELSLCDGSPENVASAEILAARVRSVARAALQASTEKA